MSSFQTIKTRSEGRVGVLTFDRPTLLNAFNSALIGEVNAAMIGFIADPNILAIVVHGNGRAFSAGFDMKESSGQDAKTIEEWRAELERDFAFIMQFWDCPKPTIAAIHGHCLAGAFELSLACDMTVAAEGTKLGEPEVRFGGGLVALLLPWMTTPKFAKELILTGNDRIDAARGYELGVINYVVPQGQEFAKAMAIAGHLTAAAPSAVMLSKRAINRSYEAMGMRQSLLGALDIDIIISAAGGPERTEFNRIRNEQGLKAAFAWRDSRFGQD